MKYHRITQYFASVWQRLITWSALAPLVALCLFLGQTQAQAQAPPAPDNGWVFSDQDGETAAPTFGAAAGTLSGGVEWVTDDPFGGGGSVSFDGSDGIVTMEDLGEAFNGESQFTLSLWIRSNGMSQDRGFWEAVDSGGADAWGLRYDSTGANAGGSNVFKVGITTSESNGNVNRNQEQQESHEGAQTTEWQHVAFTWDDGAGFKLYIDGVLDEPTSAMQTTTGTLDRMDRFVIGDGAKAYWDGLIDEVAVWRAVLTAENIEWLSNNSVTGATDPQPPSILDTIPASGVSFYAADDGLSFRLTSSGAIATERVKLLLNGIDVSGDLAFSGDPTDLEATFSRLQPNQIYRTEIRTLNAVGAVRSKIIIFDTFSADNPTVEVENWNYDGGGFIDDPMISWQEANSYIDRGVEIGVQGVDFMELNTDEGRPNPDEWRIPFEGQSMPQTAISQDEVRQEYLDAEMDDYDLVFFRPGEWVNYTKTFEEGHYQVILKAAVLSSGTTTMTLERVIGNATLPDQVTAPVGVFIAPGDGSSYDWIPATDISGAPVTVSLNGKSTLRLTKVSGDTRLNYLMFVEMETSTAAPSVVITAPVDGAAFVPGADVSITADASDSDGQVARIEFFAETAEGRQSVGVDTQAPYEIIVSNVPEANYILTAEATDNDGMISRSSAITVFVDATPPSVISVVGKQSLTAVLIQFSEVLRADTATNIANYSVSSANGAIAVTEAELSADGTTVTLITDLQITGDEYTITMNNLSDLAGAGNVIPADTQVTFNAVGPLLQGEDGFVIWEAEAFDRNPDGLWLEDPDREGASGGVSMVNPNGTGGNESNTQLQYDIIFTKTGTHIIWYRAGSDSGTDDSMWLHVDGARPPNRTTGNQASMTGFSGSIFEWNSRPQDGGGQMTFEIDEPGLHTIAAARREDGSYADKFIITTDPNFNPNNFGEFGPPSTPRQGEVVQSNNQVEISLNPVDTAGVENASVTLTGDAAITPEDALMVLQWQLKVGDEFIDLSGETGTSFMVSPLTLDWDGAVVRFNATSIGASAVSQEAVISVIPETAPPQALRAHGNAIQQRVSVTFSEPLNVSSAEKAGNYKITSAEGSLEVLTATLLGNPRIVLLETSEQVVGAKYTITLNNIADTAATPNILNGGQVKFYSLGALLPQTDDGLIVFEAESYDVNTDDLWVEDFSRGMPSGGVSMVLPNGAGGNETSSQLQYDVEFTKTGVHIVWYRASGDNGTDDSSWFWLDDARPANRVDGNQASMTGFSGNSDFVWVSDPQDGASPYTIEIDELGLYTIALARREDGSFFDKFVITDDFDFDPNDYGPMGPPETREGSPALPEVTLITPMDGEQFESGTSIPLEVEIGASDRNIVRVQYFAGVELIAESTTKPFSTEWAGAAAGEHDLSAVVIDDVNDLVVTEHALVTVVTVEPIQITELNLDGTGANLIMEWQGGVGPYTVQKTTSLSAPVWDDVGVDVFSPLTLPVDGATGFFRIVAP